MFYGCRILRKCGQALSRLALKIIRPMSWSLRSLAETRLSVVSDIATLDGTLGGLIFGSNQRREGISAILKNVNGNRTQWHHVTEKCTPLAANPAYMHILHNLGMLFARYTVLKFFVLCTQWTALISVKVFINSAARVPGPQWPLS